MAATTRVQDFLALPVKYKETDSVPHWLYCKEHAVREKTTGKPAGRTLFVLNVPPFFTETCLRKTFAECGQISSVFFHKKPTAALPEPVKSQYFDNPQPVKGYKVAYVVFSASSELQAALKLKWKKPKVVHKKTDKDQPLSALERWKQKYNEQIPVVSELQADIDLFMEEHDRKVEEEEQISKETEGQADEDGWVTVTRKGRKPGFARKESVEQKVLEKEGKKKAKKELLNFYSFQIRESKMNHLAELRQKFEEDKKRISQLRQSRRFRPF